MANNPGNSDKFRAAGREKFDLNLRSHLEICHGKKTHADVAEIDTKTIQLGRLGEYLHGGVQQLAFPASPVWFEAPFEDHLSTGKDTVAKRSLRAKITNVQWNGERLFNRYLGLSKTRLHQLRIVGGNQFHSQPAVSLELPALWCSVTVATHCHECRSRQWFQRMPSLWIAVRSDGRW